jgi:hypothetical protein
VFHFVPSPGLQEAWARYATLRGYFGGNADARAWRGFFDTLGPTPNPALRQAAPKSRSSATCSLPRHSRQTALPVRRDVVYSICMILIRFPNPESKRSALGRLAGRFRFKSFATGEMLVPEDALAFLAVEGIVFIVQGPATYEQIASAVRGAPAFTA